LLGYESIIVYLSIFHSMVRILPDWRQNIPIYPNKTSAGGCHRGRETRIMNTTKYLYTAAV
jgi:hypothetical protein